MAVFFNGIQSEGMIRIISTNKILEKVTPYFYRRKMSTSFPMYQRLLIILLVLPVFTLAQFPDAGEKPPLGWSGKVFKLSQNFPKSPGNDTYMPWLKIDFKKDPLKYVQVVYEYILQGNTECDWVVQNNKVRPWYHVPWMDWRDPRDGTLGREFINGLTRERDSKPYELGPDQNDFVQNWAIGLYNQKGGYVIGRVWRNPQKPDPDVAEFPEGTVCGKLLFTACDTVSAPYLKYAPQWQANIHTSVNEKFRKRVVTMHLLQFDIAVRDSRANDGSGWVFGTLIYDGDAPFENPWMRMVPAGLSWGNDAGVTADLVKHGEILKQNFINPKLKEKFKFGWGGRLNGPVDNPNSGCISCHSTAQFPMVSSQAPSDNASSAERMHWFRETLLTGHSFSAGSVSMHYSMQLAISLENFYIYHKLHPHDGRMKVWSERINRIIGDYYILIFICIVLSFWFAVKKIPAFSTTASLMNYDGALLILRIGIGIMFMIHGFPKLIGGPPAWTRLGQSMANFGLYIYPSGWGFLAAFAEAGGGVLMITGLFFRPAMLMLCIHMTVACFKHYNGGDTIETASHAVEALCIFLFLLLAGPGKFALDRILFKPKGA
jgi:uncharacterized membrane protein YphA (DoxX/SURF4 family)